MFIIRPAILDFSRSGSAGCKKRQKIRSGKAGCQMLYEFLKGTARNNQFTVYDCINADDQWLECTHDYIQWCFPNRRPSAIIENAPVLTDTELNKILNDKTCIRNIKSMTDRMMRFYDRHPVKSSLNHNCKRITRILLFLKEINDDECKSFYHNVAERFILQYGRNPLLRITGISKHTVNYWNAAVSGGYNDMEK